VAKHSKKHIVTHYRGKPVKPKREKRTTRGRPAQYPASENAFTMVRSTPEERAAWHAAAARDAEALGLPPSKLTIGVWLRRLANLAAFDASAQG
jgi:hypothetical protein